MIEVECVVIGAGVVGLAVARSLAMAGQEVIVLEQEDAIGSHTSSRNSEVIHAGIYYPQHSLKALHCVQGKAMLYQYCREKKIPVNPCGKLIVANGSAQQQGLEELHRKAIANGVDDVVWLNASEVNSLEPALRATAALLSPSTGVIDSHSYMLQLQGDIESNGGHVLLKHAVLGGQVLNHGKQKILDVKTPTGNEKISSKIVVNSAGLFATYWLKQVEGFSARHIPPMYFAKGNYFSLAKKSPFSHLIYPLPNNAGLGVHLTLDISGKAKFGPDVEWLPTVISPNKMLNNINDDLEFDYSVNDANQTLFYQAIKEYYPEIELLSLTPDYSGVRPKLIGQGGAPTDFVIQDSAVHGIDGWVNLFGIESPGLTASLSLASYVLSLTGKN